MQDEDLNRLQIVIIIERYFMDIWISWESRETSMKRKNFSV